MAMIREAEVILPLPEENVIEVKWSRTIMEGGEVVFRREHFHHYTIQQKAQFIANVQNPANGGSEGVAAQYLAAVGWTPQ